MSLQAASSSLEWSSGFTFHVLLLSRVKVIASGGRGWVGADCLHTKRGPAETHRSVLQRGGDTSSRLTAAPFFCRWLGWEAPWHSPMWSCLGHSWKWGLGQHLYIQPGALGGRCTRSPGRDRGCCQATDTCSFPCGAGCGYEQVLLPPSHSCSPQHNHAAERVFTWKTAGNDFNHIAVSS